MAARRVAAGRVGVVAGSVEAAAEEGQHQVGDHVRHICVALALGTKWWSRTCGLVLHIGSWSKNVTLGNGVLARTVDICGSAQLFLFCTSMSVLGFQCRCHVQEFGAKCYIVVEEIFVNVLAISVGSTWLTMRVVMGHGPSVLFTALSRLLNFLAQNCIRL